jgi:hypothetical protein
MTGPEVGNSSAAIHFAPKRPRLNGIVVLIGVRKRLRSLWRLNDVPSKEVITYYVIY